MVVVVRIRVGWMMVRKDLEKSVFHRKVHVPPIHGCEWGMGSRVNGAAALFELRDLNGHIFHHFRFSSVSDGVKSRGGGKRGRGISMGERS